MARSLRGSGRLACVWRGKIPLYRAAQALFEAGARPEAKQAGSARGVEVAARLAVGFGPIPADLAREAGQPGDQLGQAPDGDLHARAQVDRRVAVVLLGRQQDALGRVGDVEELARGAAVAPALDGGVPVGNRVDTLRDECRDDV